MATASQATFPGFQFPNTTQIPNEVFDTLMSKLSGFPGAREAANRHFL